MNLQSMGSMNPARRAARNALLLTIIGVSLGGCGGGDDASSSVDSTSRTVDLGGATSPAPLSTPDDAAKILLVNFLGLSAASPIASKVSQLPDGASNCTSSGNAKREANGNDDNFHVDFTLNRCLDDTEYYDGIVKLAGETNNGVYTQDTRFGSGSDNGAVLFEDRNSQFRTIVMATYLSTSPENGNGKIETAVDIKGRDESLSGVSSQNYQLNPYHLTIDNTNGANTYAYTGTITAKGRCVTGTSSVNTPSALEKNSSGYYNSGMMTISSGNNNAAVTFNSDATITIDAAGGSKTYSPDQFSSICGF